MKKKTAVVGMVDAAMTGIPSAAFADGTSDPYKDREDCEKRGEAESVEKLKLCCSNLIVMAKASDQRKAEDQCVKGKGGKPAAAPKKDAKQASFPGASPRRSAPRPAR